MTVVAESDTRRVPRPRADALRNRERIVAAAREILVESGPDVPLDEIARRAGVGNATLYRHFPDRSALILEVVHSVMARTADQAQRAAAEEADAFVALSRFVHAAADERIGALCPLLSGSFNGDLLICTRNASAWKRPSKASWRRRARPAGCAPTSRSVT